MPTRFQFDPWDRGLVLLTLVLSIQASYAAPLILLAQNRQTDRDRVQFSDDRSRTDRLIADADYLTQIVTNLVDNAVKFAARAQRREIELGCRLQRDGRVVLSVRDYGPGVARDQVTRVFQPFFRAGDELTRETAGTGIGLGLVREMAQAMGAEADVVNREPGAEFRVIFRQAGPRQGLAGAMPRRCRGRRAE